MQVPNSTARWQRHICVNNLSRVVIWKWPWFEPTTFGVVSPMRSPLRRQTTAKLMEIKKLSSALARFASGSVVEIAVVAETRVWLDSVLACGVTETRWAQTLVRHVYTKYKRHTHTHTYLIIILTCDTRPKTNPKTKPSHIRPRNSTLLTLQEQTDLRKLLLRSLRLQTFRARSATFFRT